MKLKSHCKHGHEFTPANETWFTDINGKPQRTCRKCYNARRNKKYKLKYRNDKEFRDRQKSKSARYKAKCRASQDQSQLQINPLS